SFGPAVANRSPCGNSAAVAGSYSSVRAWASIAVGLAIAATVSGGLRAQTLVRPLHRPIPGDLPLDAPQDDTQLTPPASPSAIQSSAGPNHPWTPQPVDETVTHPRTSWETPMRELDRQTRSPPDARLAYSEVFTP